MDLKYFLASDATGRITGRGSATADLFPLLVEALAMKDVDGVQVTEGVFLTADPERMFIANGILCSRPPVSYEVSKAAIVANGADEVVISGLPIPCVVEHNGKGYHITDGKVDLSANEPGLVTLTVHAWPHLATTISVPALSGPGYPPPPGEEQEPSPESTP